MLFFISFSGTLRLSAYSDETKGAVSLVFSGLSLIFREFVKYSCLNDGANVFFKSWFEGLSLKDLPENLRPLPNSKSCLDYISKLRNTLFYLGINL